MTRKVLLRSPAIRRKPSPKDEKVDPPREKRQFAEVAGGSAAECTAICCCCPWTVLNLVIFAVYKMPAGLYRKAMNKRKRRRFLEKKSLIRQRRPASPDFTAGPVGRGREGCVATNDGAAIRTDGDPGSLSAAADLMKLEEEMWGRFSQTGFWRSPSQRHE